MNLVEKLDAEFIEMTIPDKPKTAGKCIGCRKMGNGFRLRIVEKHK